MVTLPVYFIVDEDISVKVYKDGEDVVAINQYNNPYPPMKALVDGRPITQEEFNRSRSAASASK